MNNKTKKYLALFFAGIIVLSAVAGILWPSSDPGPSQAGEQAAMVDDQNGPDTATVGGEETTPESAALSDETETLLSENDRLLVETYGLELPVSIPARETILETHQLLIEFERAIEEFREFADETRYSCQQFIAAISSDDSGPQTRRREILLKIVNISTFLDSLYGEDRSKTADLQSLLDDYGADLLPEEIELLTALSKFESTEVEAISVLVKKFDEIDSTLGVSDQRALDCALELAGGILDPANIPGQPSQRDSNRQADFNQIVQQINNYIATRNALPNNWSDIEPLLDTNLKHFSAARINTPGSWDGSALPAVAGDFSWSDGYINPPADDAAINHSQSNNLLIIKSARCNDGLVTRGGLRTIIIIYRLESQEQAICAEI